jgi:hypothetical protein
MKHQITTTMLTTSMLAILASINVLQAEENGTNTVNDPGTLPSINVLQAEENSTNTVTDDPGTLQMNASTFTKCPLTTLSPNLKLDLPVVHYHPDNPDSLFLSVKLQGFFLPNTEENQMWFQMIDSESPAPVNFLKNISETCQVHVIPNGENGYLISLPHVQYNGHDISMDLEYLMTKKMLPPGPCRTSNQCLLSDLYSSAPYLFKVVRGPILVSPQS